MKIGYPCINRSEGWTTGHKPGGVKNAKAERIREKIRENIDDMWKILDWNVKNDIEFFRIGSQFIPYATHPDVHFDWKTEFGDELKEFGCFENKIRFSMHPDHFVILNSNSDDIVEKSIKDLEYHASLMDMMGLDSTHKMQIHGGGLFGNKQLALKKWVKNYSGLPDYVKNRLVIENDDYRFSVQDCLYIHNCTGVPILFDTLHHECLNHGETVAEGFCMCHRTWREKDGVPMIDYSCQEKGERKGKHCNHVDMEHFLNTIGELHDTGKDCDIMCEIKDKDVSVVEILNYK